MDEFFSHAFAVYDTEIPNFAGVEEKIRDRSFLLENVRFALQRKSDEDLVKKDFLNLEVILRIDIEFD